MGISDIHFTYLEAPLRLLPQQPDRRLFYIVDFVVEVALGQEVANLQAGSVSLP